MSMVPSQHFWQQRDLVIVSIAVLFWSLPVQQSLAETYFVTPTLDIPIGCPGNHHEPCMTLSQFANKSANYFASNTTLVLLPGNHTLDQHFKLTGFVHVRVVTETTPVQLPATRAVVTCSNTAAKFQIGNGETVHIKGISTVGCSHHQFFSLKQFLLESSNITGHRDDNDSGVFISAVIETIISGTTFSTNAGLHTPEHVSLPSLQIGGALVSVNNSFVNLKNCCFYNNSVSESSRSTIKLSMNGTYYGGAVYVYQSTIQISNCSFVHNTASDLRGVVYAVNSTVAFNNCTMSHNMAGQGGVIYADILTDIAINNSTFSHNEAIYGAAIFAPKVNCIEIDSSTFHNNAALISGGVLYIDNWYLKNNTLKIINSFFDSNAASSAGVIHASNVTVVIHNSFFQYNRAEASAGVITALAKALVTISYSTFSHNSASLSAGVIGAVHSTTLVIHNSHFLNNSVSNTSGGVLAAFHNAKVNIDGSQFEYNRAKLNGGAVFASNSVNITVSGSHFLYNTAEFVYGGVLYAEHETMISIDAQTMFHGNEAGSWGGVLYATNFSVIETSNAGFENNSAKFGGAMAVTNDSKIVMRDCTLQYNQAVFGGAIVTMDSMSVSINSSIFQYNEAYQGGVVAAENTTITICTSQFLYNGAAKSFAGAGVLGAHFYCDVRVSSSTFRNNKAGSGGVIVSKNFSVIHFYNSTFDNNTAAHGNGGVVLSSYDTRLSIYDSHFRFSIASKAGGVIVGSSNTSIIIKGSEFKHNRAGQGGGVLFATNNTSITIGCSHFQHNVVENGDGGVLFVQFDSFVSMNDQCTFHGNKVASIRFGGVVFATEYCTIQINDAILENNVAGSGGAIAVSNDTVITTQRSSFQLNQAALIGGVIFAEKGTFLVINGGSFSNNSATQSAGVIGVHANAIVVITNSHFDFNQAANYGGILTAQQNISVSVNSSTFHHNKAGFGGVFFVKSSNAVAIHTSIFNNNSAVYGGGAIFAEEDTTVLISESIFTFNEVTCTQMAMGPGGGVLAASFDTSIVIDGSLFIHNTARGSGGGVALVSNNTSVAISGSHFQYNKAEYGHGGVLYAQFNCSVSINARSSFQGNEAVSPYFWGGVAYAKEACTISITLSAFESNVAATGGVVAIKNDTTVTVQGSTFRYNQAGHLDTNITTAGFGGVIYATHFSLVHFYNTIFENNTATNGGGVILARYLTRIEIYNCHLQYNAATMSNTTAGGGVIAAMRNVTVIINGSQFMNNRAKLGGGVGYFSTNTSVTITSSHFQYNTADSYSRGGVIYAQNSSVVSINAQSAFHSNKAGKAGGVVYAEAHCKIEIFHAVFQNNTAETGIITVVNGTKVVIHGSNFQYNQAKVAGVVAAINNTDIKIRSTIFRHNRASESGGVLYLGKNSSSIIQSTQMNSNSAGWGGGVIACTGSLGFSTTLTVEHLTLTNNSAYGFGMVMYLHVCKLTSFGFLNISNNVDVSSTGILYLLQSTAVFMKATNISNNVGSVFAIESTVTFMGVTRFNNGYSGLKDNTKNGVKFMEAGSLTLFNSALYLVGSTSIIGNHAGSGGAIIAIDSEVHSSGVTFIANNVATSSGGGIYVYQSVLSFSGKTTFASNIANNTGGAIHAIGSTVKFFSGTHHFIGNVVAANGSGGALFLELNSKIEIIKSIDENHNCSHTELKLIVPCVQNSTRWLELEFTNNSAGFGGAICVKDSANSDSCHSKPLNTYLPTNECFLQTLPEYYSAEPFLGIPVQNTLFFNNNASKAGSAVYGGLLDRCTLSPLVGEVNYTQIQYLQEVTNVELESISSLAVRVCFCDTNGRPNNCSFQPAPFKVNKGQSFTVSAVVVDQVNHTLPLGRIHCSPSSQNGGLAEGQTRQDTFENCTDLTYTVFSPNSFEDLICYADGPCNDLGISRRSLKVHFLPCPPGFALAESTFNSTCECDPYLKPKYVTNCSISTNSLLRKNDAWITSTGFISTDTKTSGYVVYSHCPFDYCYPPTQPVFFNLKSPSGVDRQCFFNRSGKLCGKCKPGLSISLGSTHCISCSNYWLLLLVPFALAGITLVAFMLSLNLTVAVGTLNGIVFYANIVGVNREVYFPFEKPNFLTVFLSWVNLDLGFKACFYDGMDAYVKTWLQFVFPLYIILLVVAIIEISHYSPRFASLFTGKNPVATLATLILLSHTKLLRAIIAAMSFAQLKYPDGSQEMVWLLDANVKYLHIPLFIAAAVTALVGLTYTLVLFSWQWLLRCPRSLVSSRWMTNSKLLAFIDAYHAPYSKQHRYWTGMFFLLRTVLYLVSAVNVLGDPRVNLVSILSVMVFIFSMYSIMGQKPLKTYTLNLLEITHFFNLTMFTTLTFYFIDSHNNQTVLAFISASIAAALFGSALIYHTYAFLLLRRKEKLNSIWRRVCNMRQTRYFVYTDEIELPNVAAGHDEQSGEVSVTEINGLPSISSTIDSDDDSECTQQSQNESDIESVDCDEIVPLLMDNNVMCVL